MQDPMTVAFVIARPWPTRDAWNSKRAAEQGIRWRTRRHHSLVLAGQALRFPALVTVWHRDPSGIDDIECPIYPGNAWRFHIHHWHLQIHPLQQLRRRLLTRCTECGGRSTKANPISLGSWGRERAPWWRGETGMAHMACKGLRIANPDGSVSLRDAQP